MNRPGSHSMPTSICYLLGAIEDRLDRFDELLGRLTSGGIPPSVRPVVMLMFWAPMSRAKSIVLMIIRARSARWPGLGLIRLGSK